MSLSLLQLSAGADDSEPASLRETAAADPNQTGVPAAVPLPVGNQRIEQPQRKPAADTVVPPPPTPMVPSESQTVDPGQTHATQPAGTAAPPPQIHLDANGLITMHTNELDIRQLLEIISRRSGMNILVSPHVTGVITANFEKVTKEQLLESILKLANLEVKKEGPIHYVYTQEELLASREAKKRERILTKVYKLNYIRADELMTMIGPFLSDDVGKRRIQTTPNYIFGISEAPTFGTVGITTGGMSAGGGAGGGASSGLAVQPQRGIQPPTGGNSMSGNDVLVVQDYESNLKIVDQIVQRLDTQPVQVLIEAVIISVTLDRTKELGVNFAVVDNLGQDLGVVGSGAAINANAGFTPSSVLTAAGKIAGAATTDPTGFASAANGIKFGFVSNNVTGFIRALETLGSTKVLASPRVLVLNKQRAEIQLGQRLGFRGITAQNYTSTVQAVQFLNVGTLLRLRPIVSTDGMVRLEIHPERSQGEVNADGLPNASTAEVTTNVMIPDGATIVIGGLMEDEDDYIQQGLPGLSRIPAIGHLFGLKQKRDVRRELVVLLTPHIWNPAQAGRVSDTFGDVEVDPRLGGTNNRAVTPVVGSPPSAPRQVAIRTPSERAGTDHGPAPTVAAPPSTSLPVIENRGNQEAPAETSGDEARSKLGLFPWPSLPEGVSLKIPAVASPLSPPLEAAPPGDRNPIRPAAAKAPAQAPAINQKGTRPAPSPASEFVLLPAPTPARPEPPRQATATTVQAKGPRGVARVVRSGESFQSIAGELYGNEQLGTALWWANRGTVPWPGALKPGISLNLPRKEELVASSKLRPELLASRQNGASSAPAAFPLSASEISRSREIAPRRDPSLQRTGGIQENRDASQAPAKQSPAAEVQSSGDAGFAVHVVRRGETLESIAKFRLGDPRRSDEIRQLNKETIKGRNRLAPGQRLILPADAAMPVPTP